MTDNDSTKNMPDNLSDRQILLELRQVVGVLVERVTELKKRTNPLPPNYDARFTALEESIKGLEHNHKQMAREFRGIREDLERERLRHCEYEERLDVLEKRAA